ncbi:DUF4123 domain-containing protein [Noviherbaspirillum denitrificans]|uniref:DUF4123 domain-containing protein n=1 Tax=Noviherbaspirillum denitrificans TaxID=1968433 RepID=A0A254TIR0_9BURK|nr:DUF4123 domain-containing protein [Noviherbaspirillum denitrificans]OWW22375.1 hypothetical protein AYR66_25650 [Noviherbaspirillum denitrificans]
MTDTRLGLQDTAAAEIEVALRSKLIQYPQSDWYALVDAAQIADFGKSIRRAPLKSTQHISLFNAIRPETRNTDAGAGAAPYLVSLGKGPSAAHAIAYMVQNAMETHAISWLASPLPIQELARRLGSRTEAQLSGNMEVLLRYYDTRVLPNVLSVLTPGDAAIFSSIANAWWYVDRDNRLCSYACNFTENDAFVPPIAFSQSQEDMLTDLAFPDTVLAHLKESQNDLISRLGRGEQHAFVKRLIARTRALQLNSIAEILTCCVIALMEGEESLEDMSMKERVSSFAGNDAMTEK